MKMKIGTAFFLLGVLFVESGCVVKAGGEWTRRRGEKPVAWRFGSGKAAATFMRAVFSEEPQEDRDTLWMGLVVKGGLPIREEMKGPLILINAAFREADRDGNGVLSEREASDFLRVRQIAVDRR
jgi:hypothetical protein